MIYVNVAVISPVAGYVTRFLFVFQDASATSDLLPRDTRLVESSLWPGCFIFNVVTYAKTHDLHLIRKIKSRFFFFTFEPISI